MTARRPPPRRRGPRTPATTRDDQGTRMFATAVPGLAVLVRRELTAHGITVIDTGFDGRADIVRFEADPETLPPLSTVEDLFIEVGQTLRSEGDRPQWISRRLWRRARVQRALAFRGARPTATFRVIARVRQERSFRRTELRRHFTGLISTDRPQWRIADPAQLEFWAVEYSAGKFIAGLRISDATLRQHDGRAVERPGALRPTVAAAMVNLAIDSDRATVLDPCCGSGTILRAVIDRDATALGRDIDTEAVAIATRNVPAAKVEAGDVHDLDLPDDTVDACVSNLPFGRQYQVRGDPVQWLHATVQELARVTKPGGRIVLLAPSMQRDSLRLVARYPIRLLGYATTIWVLENRGLTS